MIVITVVVRFDSVRVAVNRYFLVVIPINVDVKCYSTYLPF